MAKKKAKGPLPEEHVRKLARRLMDRQLSLFVGAGISHLAPTKDGTDRRLPLWSDLTEQVAAACDEDVEVFAGDPLDLFDAIVYGQERGRLESAVATALDDSDYDLAPAHHALGDLPWRALVSTNYDGLLQRLVEEEPITTEADYDRRSAPEDEQPRLFQIHGTRLRPHTLTREDYRLWEKKHPRAARHIFELMERGTILFVGYSLSDPHLDAILTTVRQMTREREKRLYAWMWRYPEQKARLLDRRDKIEAISIEEETHWEAAFRQLAAAVEELRREKGPVPATTEADSFAYDREQYLAAVRTRFGAANLQGLYVWGAGYARDDVALQEVFVEPDLLRREPGPRGEPDSEVPTTLRELRRRRDESPDEPGPPGRRLPAFTLFQQEPRLAVVGAPGQGKSTLLRSWLLKTAQRWAADPSAHPLPILVRLAEWERGAESGETGLLEFARRRLPSLGEIGSNAVESWLEGSVLWLLDGVDEVRDRYERERLREEVLALASRRPGDRWIVSTRPAGEPAGGWAAGWTRTELPSLTDRQIEFVLSAWGRVLEAKEGLVLDAPQMARDLQRDPGLRAVRGNALLLTLAVLFYKTRRRLPKDRWEFLAGAEQALRDSWVHHRVQRAADHLPGAYLPGLLERLALAGMEEGVVLFSRKRLEDEAADLLTERGYTGAERDREVERFLRAAEDLIGVLVAQGPDQFGFLHLTFQEFLAARALVNRSAEAPGYIARCWDHPDWEQVWVLYALGVESDPNRLAELHETILESSHSLDEYLERPRFMSLRLAGAGSAYLPDGARESVEWATRLLCSESLTWKSLHLWHLFQTWERDLPKPVVHAALETIGHRDGLIGLAVAHVLQLVASDSTVRSRLLEALRSKDSHFRSTAVLALEPVASESWAFSALLRQLEDEDLETWLTAATTLGSVASESHIRQALIERLRSKKARVRLTASQALSSVASAPEVKEALLQRLNDSDSDVRATVIRALRSVASEPPVLNALLDRTTDKQAEVRSSAVYMLGSSAFEPKVKAALIERLEDRDSRVRYAAITSLRSANSDPAIQRALLQRFDDDDPEVRWTAAECLSSVADQDAVQQVLIERLKHEDPDARSNAIWSLDSVATEGEVRSAILARLNDESAEVRTAAADVLGSASSEPEVREALLSRLQDQDSNVRSSAARALGSVAPDSQVRDTLLDLLDDENRLVRETAARALRFAISELQVRQALLGRLEQEEAWFVQETIVGSLAAGISLEKFGLE